MNVALASPVTTPRELSKCLEDAEAPIAVRLIDLEYDQGDLRLPPSRSGEPYRQLLAFLRWRGHPLGWIAAPVSPGGEVSLDDLMEGVGSCSVVCNGIDSDLTAPGIGDMQMGGVINEVELPSEGSAPRSAAGGLLSVVVATCANAPSIVRCVQAIQAGATGAYEVIVVENRPQDSIVRRALDEHFHADARIRYVEERRPGLACARNAGLRVARGELVGFTDDDVVVDPAWVPAVRNAFAAMPDVDCVTGLILPHELETPAQILLERFASYGKGLVPRVYSLEHPPADQPLFPYTAGYFVSGANMAFRTEVLRSLDGFDPRLGTGTRARGGEDFDVCIRLLQAQRRLAYEPRAIIWHTHPDTHLGLRRRAFDYGAAVGAMFTKQLVKGPDRWRMVSRTPQGIRYYTDPRSRKNAARGPVFPRNLTRLERAGLLFGPVAYVASALEVWR